ncbi:MAG: ATP-binding protein [Oceanipulchritudo sp.]
MKILTPIELTSFLAKIVHRRIRIPVILWSPPGVGKSAIIRTLAREHGMHLIDLRLSQLMPSDLRGIPIVEDGVMRFSRPNFLPRGDGKFILFLDELNMAPPAQQGNAQQLLLDRRVGDHLIAEDTFIWAACNRKQDRAAVNDMPAPVANRALHIEVKVDIDSFSHYAMTHPGTIHEDILGFLNFRTNLLHAYESGEKAFPSPRSWEYASRLLGIGESIAAAVGIAAEGEFNAFVRIKTQMPPVEKIMGGNLAVPFPGEPSLRYGVVFALIHRAEEKDAMVNAFRWLARQATPEWVSLFVKRVFPRMEALGLKPRFIAAMGQEPKLMDFVRKYRAYMQDQREWERKAS